MAIPGYIHPDPILPQWELSFTGGGSRKHKNNSTFNPNKNSRKCHISGCATLIPMMRSSSGLCMNHRLHTDDLVLDVLFNGNSKLFPGHIEIIELLIEWAHTRNYDLNPFFEELAFNILGNIPDSTTLNGDTALFNASNMSLQSLTQNYMLNVVDRFFPTSNSSSYQVLVSGQTEFPARILATIFAGLVLCDEATRGNRWFCRNVLKDESRTSELGGALPLAYFAARSFHWGVEMKSVMHLLVR